MLELQIELDIGMEVNQRMVQFVEITDNALDFLLILMEQMLEDFYSCGNGMGCRIIGDYDEIINTVVGFDNYGYYKHRDEDGELIETSVRAKVKVGDNEYVCSLIFQMMLGILIWQNYLTWVAEGNTAEVVGD